MVSLRSDFPFFIDQKDSINYIYFDNASTTQKPQVMIDAISEFYAHQYASIGRGVYKLAEQTTQRFEDVRAQTARFLGARSAEEIIFTSGATHSANFIARSWAHKQLKAGDEIVVSGLEHHANLIPWQIVAQQTGSVLKFLPITPHGDLDYDRVPNVITSKTKFVAITHSSNALGTQVALEKIIPVAHAAGARVLVDGSQSTPHKKIDLKGLGCDFFICTAHKMCGPTGLGILYIRKEVQSEVDPYHYGGGMVYEADYRHATFLEAPRCFEAGTPPIAQVIAFGAVLNYFEKKVNFLQLQQHESELMTRCIDGLQSISRITLYGPLDHLKKHGHVLTFNIEGVHPHDVAAFLDTYNICVRSGHYCAQPLAKKIGIDGSVRVSFYMYNTTQEIDSFLDKIDRLSKSI